MQPPTPAQSGGSPPIRDLLALCAQVEALTAGGELDVLLRSVLQQWLQVLPAAHTVALFLYRSGVDHLLVAGRPGYERDELHQATLKAGEFVAAHVFYSGQSELCATPGQVAAAMSEQTRTAAADEAELQYPYSLLCVPLDCGGERIGVLVAESWERGAPFYHADLQLAQRLAPLTALAIERARLAHELATSQAALEQAHGLQSYVLSALSHEMRTPLANIKGYASALLLDDVEWSPADQCEYLNVVVDESDKLSEILSNLLESSLIDAGLLHIERQPTRLARLAQSVLDDVAQHTSKHRFLLNFPPDLPIVDVDPGRIRRLLYNLLDNAVKYSSEGGLIVMRAQVVGDECVVSVADQGRGIAPEHLNRLFDRFYRVKGASGEHVVGSGLGLPIARHIVEAHGGRIWAESKVGEGSTFTFTLPLSAATQDRAESE